MEVLQGPRFEDETSRFAIKNRKCIKVKICQFIIIIFYTISL